MIVNKLIRFIQQTRMIFLSYAAWCDMFNIRRVTQWAFADGLRVNSEADLKTISLVLLIFRQVTRSSLCKGTPRSIIDRELEGHCIHDGFYMHQAPLAYMVVISQRRASNTGRPVSNPPLYLPTRLPRPPYVAWIYMITWYHIGTVITYTFKAASLVVRATTFACSTQVFSL